MSKDIKINVDTQTDQIVKNSNTLGISSENLQGKIIFTPKPFIDGVCRMYIENHGTIEMDKQEDCYTLDIKSSLLIAPGIDICFKITEPEQDNGVPIYATKIMYFKVEETIESSEPIPDQYPQWKDVLDKYTQEKKDELDTYNTEKKTELDEYKTTLETEMSTTKDTLVKEFNDTTTQNIEEFNNNVETKTTNFNKNAETKTEEFNTNATNKVAEFNNNVDSLENELTELASQMPWNTTEIQDSIHIEDSAKYSRNRLSLFGNLKQKKRSGKNLFNKEAFTYQDNYYGDDGEEYTSTITGHTTMNIEVLPDTKYTASGYLMLPTPKQGTVSRIYFYDSNKNWIKRSELIADTKFTFTTPSNCKFIELQITLSNNNYKFSDNLDTFQIELGDTATQYEGFGIMPSIEYPSMPVVATGVQKITKCEENLFNKDAVTLGQYIDESGNEVVFNVWCTTKYIPVRSDEKYFYFGITTPGTAPYSAYYDKDKKFISSFKQTTGKNVITIPTNAKYVRFSLKTSGLNDRETFYIKNGEIEADYEPYTEETFELDLGTTELCKIVNLVGNVMAQDKVVYREVDGVKKWQFAKDVDKLVLDGTQEIVGLSVSDITTRIQYRDLVQASDLNKRNFSNCNMLKYKSIWSSDEEAYYLDNASLGIIIRIRKDIIGTSKTSISEFFANNNLVVYYPLQETTYEDCTQEQSEVLDKLYKLQLEKGTNNIYVESENGVTTELQLTYMQDLMSQINELKQAMLNIGGN